MTHIEFKILPTVGTIYTVNDSHHDPRPWQDCTREDICAGDLVEARCDDLLYIGIAHQKDMNGNWRTEDGYFLTNDSHWPLRRIPATPTEKEATMTEPLARTLLGVPEGHGAPHHDGDQIKAGDFVAQVDKDGLVRAGIAHHVNGEGDWGTEYSYPITWAKKRADRPDALTIWPALTPPAVEVEMPKEHPAHITDVESAGGVVCAYMALNRLGYWSGVDQDGYLHTLTPGQIVAARLDGTRVRRDGEYEDGEPRFVKVREGEK